MRISVAPDSSPQRLTDFETIEVRDALHVCRHILRSAWSGIVWVNGRRRKDHFLFSDLCVLDFDDGAWGVGEAVDMLEDMGLLGIIGTTKSHQRWKDDKPPCDRFRVVIPWDGRIQDVATYEQNMERLMAHMPVDKACKDGARFFHPCREILHVSHVGQGMAWEPFRAPQKRSGYLDPSWQREVPPWLAQELEKGIAAGERNRTVFRFACYLRDRKFTQAETIDLFCQFVDLSHDEIRRTVASAWRYG